MCHLWNCHPEDSLLSPSSVPILSSSLLFNSMSLDVDALIAKLIEERGFRSMNYSSRLNPQVPEIPEMELRQVVLAARERLMEQPMLLELDAPMRIIGDIHGQFEDLLSWFEKRGYPPEHNYLFLGDYVDRGKTSIETICLLLAFKVKYPDNIFLLRGNHECAPINKMYGFFDECKRRYDVKLFKLFADVFNCLPVAAIVGKRIFCCHGGLSPDLQNIDQIRHIVRPAEVPDKGLLCDLLWADPHEDHAGWKENDRGVSYTFGADTVEWFLDNNDLDLICRAHEVMERGYGFFAKRQLVTIFSAPDYCGEFDNSGAVMSIDGVLACSFLIMESTSCVPNS